MTFSRSGTSLATRLVAGTWNSGTSSDSMIDSNGDIILDDSWSGNMNQAIVNMDTSTGLGSVSAAWQAGSGDSNTRVFNAYTATSGSSTIGCGFFGYGADFDSDYSNNTNTIDGFICNWAGPGNDHSMSGTTGKGQKQCFTQTSGVFAEDTSKRAITYAPTVSCDDTDGSFTYDFPAHSGDGATNDLVTLSGDSDFSSYTAPSAPTLDSGI